MGLGFGCCRRRRIGEKVKLNVRDDVKLPVDVPPSVGEIWYDEAAAQATDWRKSSKEEVLKHARLWDHKEDGWLKEKSPPSASNFAHKSMDLYIQKNHEDELRELRGATTNPDTPTDATTLCA